MSNLAAVTVMCCSIAATGVYVAQQVTRLRAPVTPIEPARFVGETGRRSADIGHRVGNTAAPVVLVEFVDYQCPACRMFQTVVDQLVATHPSDVAIVYRHYPLTNIHPLARTAAIASECAADQDRFLDLHRELYSSQDSLGRVPWDHFAKRAGVRDIPRFTSCLQHGTHADVIELDAAVGRDLALQGTPSFIVGDSLYLGGETLADLERLVAAAGEAARH